MGKDFLAATGGPDSDMSQQLAFTDHVRIAPSHFFTKSEYPMEESRNASTVTRDGECVVAKDGDHLPKRCIVCNTPTNRKALAVSFDNVPRKGLRGVARAVGGVAGVLLEALSASGSSNYTGPVTLNVHVCGKHRKYPWYVRCISPLVLLLAGVEALWGWMALHGNSREQAYLQACFLAFFGLLLLPLALISSGAHHVSWYITPVRFMDRFVWLKGPNDAFLKGLESKSSSQAESDGAASPE